jgi:hypothetical protein
MDEQMLHQVNEVCAAIQETRAALVHLARSLRAVRMKPQPRRHNAAEVEVAIKRVMTARGMETVKRLKNATCPTDISTVNWNRIFYGLVKSGELRIDISKFGKKLVIRQGD